MDDNMAAEAKRAEMLAQYRMDQEQMVKQQKEQRAMKMKEIEDKASITSTLPFNQLFLFLQEVHQDLIHENMSFCIPPFNHHSVSPTDAITKKLQDTMKMENVWNQESTMDITPIKGKLVDFKNHTTGVTVEEEATETQLRNKTIEKLKYFIQPEFNNVQEFKVHDEKKMMQWDILSKDENKNLLNILELMIDLDMFDVPDQIEFMKRYNEMFFTHEKFPEPSQWSSRILRLELGYQLNTRIGGYYKCFRDLFQKIIKFRFGIVDGLHRCSGYMTCLNDIVTRSVKWGNHRHFNIYTPDGKVKDTVDRQTVTQRMNKEIASLSKIQLRITWHTCCETAENVNVSGYHSKVVKTLRDISSSILMSNKLVVQVTCKDIICDFLNAYDNKYNLHPLHERIKSWNSNNNEPTKKNDLLQPIL